MAGGLREHRWPCDGPIAAFMIASDADTNNPVGPLPKLFTIEDSYGMKPARVEISKGNHAVSGVPGPIEETAALVCLHAPLRSGAVLAAKAAMAPRVHEEHPDPGIAWQTKRWGRLAAEGRLDEEWAANSQAHGTLDVRGTSRPLTFDTTLRDVVKPWPSLPQRLRGWLLLSR